MAEVQWSTRSLRGGRVLLTGRVHLSCGHHVHESAQVRDDTRSMGQGQNTVRNLLKAKIANHMEEEHGT